MLTTALILGGLFVLLFISERWVPLRQPRAALARRLIVNVSISALAIGTAAALVRPASATALDYVSAQPFGLLQWLEVPAIAQSVIGFLLLDLTFYYWHLANHKVAFLWRFHNAHHIDPDLDVSTAFRFHFGEVAMSHARSLDSVACAAPLPLDRRRAQPARKTRPKRVD